MRLYYQELTENALQGGGESCPGGRGEAEQRGGAEAEAQEAREGVLPAHGEVSVRTMLMLIFMLMLVLMLNLGTIEGVLPAHGEVQFLVTFVCSLVTIDDN